MSAFDQSRYVGDDEGTKVAEINHTQMRLQSRERIIRDLRARCRHGRNERRLARVRKTHQTNISEQLQLELQVQLLSLASGLAIARSTVGRGREVRVSKSAPPAARSQPAVAI